MAPLRSGPGMDDYYSIVTAAVISLTQTQKKTPHTTRKSRSQLANAPEPERTIDRSISKRHGIENVPDNCMSIILRALQKPIKLQFVN